MENGFDQQKWLIRRRLIIFINFNIHFWITSKNKQPKMRNQYNIRDESKSTALITQTSSCKIRAITLRKLITKGKKPKNIKRCSWCSRKWLPIPLSLWRWCPPYTLPRLITSREKGSFRSSSTNTGTIKSVPSGGTRNPQSLRNKAEKEETIHWLDQTTNKTIS